MQAAAPRRLLASISALAAAGAMYWVGPHTVDAFSDPLTWRVLWMPVLLLAGSAALLHGRSLGAQLATRAVWWANLVLGALICAIGSRREIPPGLVLALGSGVALLAAGQRALDAPSTTFAPIAFRGTLMAVLVMTLADVQSLLLFGVLSCQERSTGPVGTMLLAVAALMTVSAIGLFRLRVWGLIGNVLGNLALIAIAATMRPRLPGGLAVAYVASAIVQLLLFVPLLRAIGRGAPAPAPRGRWASSVSVLVVMAIALVGAVLHHRGLID
jgi:hypothetical protein